MTKSLEPFNSFFPLLEPSLEMVHMKPFSSVPLGFRPDEWFTDRGELTRKTQLLASTGPRLIEEQIRLRTLIPELAGLGLGAAIAGAGLVWAIVSGVQQATFVMFGPLGAAILGILGVIALAKKKTR